MPAVAVVKAHVVGIHIVHVQVAVGMVVAIRLVVLGISQPPIAAVGSLPRSLLRSGTLHSVLRATATLVRGTSHVNNQVGFLRVVFDVLAQRVEHDGPVVLVARRPDLVASRTRVCLSTLLNLLPLVMRMILPAEYPFAFTAVALQLLGLPFPQPPAIEGNALAQVNIQAPTETSRWPSERLKRLNKQHRLIQNVCVELRHMRTFRHGLAHVLS